MLKGEVSAMEIESSVCEEIKTAGPFSAWNVDAGAGAAFT